MVEEPTGNGSSSTGYDGSAPELRAAEAEFRALESSILLARSQFFRQAGITFGTARDTYDILGYQRQLTSKEYRDRYARGGLAGRIVDVMPDATWRGEPAMELVEDEDPNTDTEFEQVWRDLDTKHQICSKLQRVDKLSRLSTYAVLLIGAVGKLDEELPKGAPDKLLYLMPFSGGGGPDSSGSARIIAMDAACTIAEYETDISNPRFGLPKSYQLKRSDITSSRTDMTTPRPVHWTRIIHIAEGLLEDEVFGQPALERVWNLLDDLDKITGGGSESFWLRANQGLHVNVDKDMALADTKNTLEELKKQADAYKHQLDRWIRTKGVEVSTLGSDVANFANPADAVITQIAGAKAIPKRILTGSEMGELASSQDRENFRDQVNGRQAQYAGPYMVRVLADRLIKYGYLLTPKKGAQEYKVVWPHIQTMTEDEKVSGAKGWAGVNASQGEIVFTDAEIRDKWAGYEPLTDEQREEIADRKAEAVKLAQEAMVATAPVPSDGKVLPFKARAAEVAEDVELLHVLTAAIEAGNEDVVLQLVGLGGPGSGWFAENGHVPGAGANKAAIAQINKVMAPGASILGHTKKFDAGLATEAEAHYASVRDHLVASGFQLEAPEHRSSGYRKAKLIHETHGKMEVERSTFAPIPSQQQQGMQPQTKVVVRRG